MKLWDLRIGAWISIINGISDLFLAGFWTVTLGVNPGTWAFLGLACFWLAVGIWAWGRKSLSK